MNISIDDELINMNKCSETFNVIMDETSKFKQALLRVCMTGTPLSADMYGKYIDTMNEFIDCFSTIAVDLGNQIKESEGIAEKSIPYEDIKEYLYGKYDYSSVLLFVDGLITGYSSGRFGQSGNSIEFENYVKEKAFPDRPENVGGLLESIVSLSSSTRPVEKADEAIFRAVKSIRWFNPNEVEKLKKAIKRTIEYLAKSDEALSSIDTMYQFNPKNAIDLINRSSDYIAYTVIAYATRIIAIYAYAKPWISGTITEAADNTADKSTDDKVIIIDELICRDHTKFAELIDKYVSICELIGIDKKELILPCGGCTDIPVTLMNSHSLANMINGTKYGSTLIANPLYQFIMNDNAFWLPWDQYFTANHDLNWFHDKLDDMVVSGMQANGEIVTPKQDLVNTIRLIGNDIQTNAEYQTLATQCFNIFTFLLYKILCVLNNAEITKNVQLRESGYDLQSMLALGETIKILRELYCEIASAIFYRLSDIKLHIDQSKDDEFKNIMASLTIKVPGGEKDDVTHKNDMMDAIPDTTRMNDVLDTKLIKESLDVYYMLPLYEELSLYDEYAQFKLGDEYYLEAEEANLFNRIIAAIRQAINKLINFFNDQRRQRAIKWCQSHKSELESMTYTGSMENVVDYKKNINMSFMDNIKNAITNINIDKVNKNFEEFRKSLYGNNDVYGFFYKQNGEANDGKEARSKLEKYVFTGNPNLNSGIKLTDDQIKNKMSDVWLPIMLDTETSISAYGKEVIAISDAIKNAKDKLATVETIKEAGENDVKVTPGKTDDGKDAPSAAEQAAEQAADQKEKTDNQNSNASDNTNNDDNKKEASDIKAKIGKELDMLAANILIPTSVYIKDYYMAVYSYIQKAYTLGRK